MLHEFITANREKIITVARAAVAKRIAPRPTPDELEHGLPLFLDQLVELLQPHAPEMKAVVAGAAASHGTDLLNMGFTVAQVVHDYGDICQAVTGLAGEQDTPISVQDFRTLNLSLDDAIAGAVTGYAEQRDRWISNAEAMRESAFAHELRNLVSTASLSFEILKRGSVSAGGSTGALLGRSLAGLRDLVDRKFALVRLDQGPLALERLPVAELIEEIEIAATLEAQQCGIHLIVGSVPSGLAVNADRQILAAAIGNLVNNALRFTPRGGEVAIRTRATADRVIIDIHDGCTSPDRSAGDAALAISRRAVVANQGLLSMRETPGKGSVFTIDLARLPLPS